MNAVNHQQLLLALQQPNIDQPVAELYRQFHPSVLAMVIAQGGTEEDANDVFQDSMLSFVQTVKAGKFRGESSIKTFFISIARHLWMNELRSRQRRQQRHENYMQTSDHWQAPPAGSVVCQSKGIETVFEHIGEVCRQLLLGFYFEKKSMRQLLEAFNYDNEQVLRNKKSKCLKKAKELLASDTLLTESLKSQLYHE